MGKAWFEADTENKGRHRPRRDGWAWHPPGTEYTAIHVIVTIQPSPILTPRLGAA